MGGKRQECPMCHSKNTRREIVDLIDTERDDVESIELVFCNKCEHHWEYREP